MWTCGFICWENFGIKCKLTHATVAELNPDFVCICIYKCISTNVFAFVFLGSVGWCGNASSLLPRWKSKRACTCGILISRQNLPPPDDGKICKMIEQLNAPLSKCHTLFARGGGVISFVEICGNWNLEKIPSCVQSLLIFLWLLWIQETRWKCSHWNVIQCTLVKTALQCDVV